MEHQADFNKPEPLNISKKQVFELAENIAHRLNYSPGDPIETVVEVLGGRIGYLDMDAWFNDKSGSIEVRGSSDFSINISSFAGPLRNRFTIAHELGHYILHSRLGEKVIRLDRQVGVSDRVEWEANWFAASFLMPEGEFQKMLKVYNGDIDSVAAYFQVSSQAASTRKKDLGL